MYEPLWINAAQERYNIAFAIWLLAGGDKSDKISSSLILTDCGWYDDDSGWDEYWDKVCGF